MPIASIPEQATLEMPIWGEMQKSMVEAYHATGADTPSAFSLWRLLPKLVPELHTVNRHTPMFFTCLAIKSDDGRDFRMLELLWGIPRHMLEALIKQTVEHDFDSMDETEDVGQVKAPGIYATSLAFPGARKGKFLSRVEIAVAIKNIAVYEVYGRFGTELSRRDDAATKSIWSMINDEIGIQLGLDNLKLLQTCIWADGYSRDSGPPDPTTLTKKLCEKLKQGLLEVEKVDHQHPKAGWHLHTHGARFMRMEKEDTYEKCHHRCQRLIAMLARRLPAGADFLKLMTSAHADDRVCHIQSPHYIGCSNDVAKRTQVYRLSRLDDINSHIGLLCCVLWSMGLQPEPKARCVLRTWNAEHLRPAEILITTLGRALVYQEGYNSIEAGGQGSTNRQGQLPMSRMNALVRSDVLQENLAATRAEIESLRDELELETGIEERLDDIEERMERLETKMADMARMVGYLGGDKARESVPKALASVVRQNARLRSACVTLDAACRWMTLLLENYGAPGNQEATPEPAVEPEHDSGGDAVVDPEVVKELTREMCAKAAIDTDAAGGKSCAAARKLIAVAEAGFGAQPECPDSNESGDEIAEPQRRRARTRWAARAIRSARAAQEAEEAEEEEEEIVVAAR
ncbi:hypothetical protein HYQ45_013042 [Verticillium longisporum]|uniref:Uncharacterized protein n=1 Tax=Verticillium longisporum TaxID=100787 RepID=A0A8I2ZET6_VERLO|nr:hypothetical protein HYQ45_013042 [Verticillium longisporum]